jgi:hypothetical protein
MNELTGLAIQQRPNNAEALARTILTQLSCNSHEPRSISASFYQIDKLRLPMTMAKRTYIQAALSPWRGAIANPPSDQDAWRELSRRMHFLESTGA